MRRADRGLSLVSSASLFPRAVPACPAKTNERTEKRSELACSSNDVETAGSSDEELAAVSLPRGTVPSLSGVAPAAVPGDPVLHPADAAISPAASESALQAAASCVAELCGAAVAAHEAHTHTSSAAAAAASAVGRGRRRRGSPSAAAPDACGAEWETPRDAPSAAGVAGPAKKQQTIVCSGAPAAAAASSATARRNGEEIPPFCTAQTVEGKEETSDFPSPGPAAQTAGPDSPAAAAPAVGAAPSGAAAATAERTRRRSMNVGRAAVPSATGKKGTENMYATAGAGEREKSRSCRSAVETEGGGRPPASKAKKKAAFPGVFKGTFYGSNAPSPKFVTTQLAVLLSSFYLLYALLCFAAFGVYLIGEGGSPADHFSSAAASPATAAQVVNAPAPHVRNAREQQASRPAVPKLLPFSLRGSQVPSPSSSPSAPAPSAHSASSSSSSYLPESAASDGASSTAAAAEPWSAGERQRAATAAEPSAGVWADTLATSSLSAEATAAAAEVVEEGQVEAEGRRAAAGGKPRDAAAAAPLLLDRHEGHGIGRRQDPEATPGRRPGGKADEAAEAAEAVAAARVKVAAGGSGEGRVGAEHMKKKKNRPSGRKATLIFDTQVYDWSSVNGRILLIIFFTSSVAMSYIVFLVVQRTRKCLDFCFSIQLLHLVACWLLVGFPVSVNWWVCSLASGIMSTLLSQHLCRKVEMQDIILRWDGRSSSCATAHQDVSSPVQRTAAIQMMSAARKHAHVDAAVDQLTCRTAAPVLIGRAAGRDLEAHVATEAP